MEERTGPDDLGPGEVDHGEAKNLSSPRLSSFFSSVESGKEFVKSKAELFLFLGGVRPSDRAGQDDVPV